MYPLPLKTLLLEYGGPALLTLGIFLLDLSLPNLARAPHRLMFFIGAFNVLALGENVPPPPLQVAKVAPPPTCPPSTIAGLAAQASRSAPALTVAAGVIVTFMASFPVPQLPPVVVSVKMTSLAVMSSGEGV